MTEDIRQRIVVGGRVQGVGFRYFCKRRADSLHLSGWTRNQSDGKVAIEVQGGAEPVFAFIDAVRSGPTLAHVLEFALEKIDLLPGDTAFEIRY